MADGETKLLGVDATSPPNGARRVCLLGPSNCGKTELLVTMAKAAREGSHGYKASFDLSIQAMDEKLRKARSAGQYRRAILERGLDQTDYARRQNQALAGTLAANSPQEVQIHDFDISYRVRYPNRPYPSTEKLSISVADGAGGHFFPEHWVVSEVPIEARSQMIDYIIDSVGLVIVLPFYGLTRPAYVRAMETLIAAVAPETSTDPLTPRQQEPKLRNIAIALHQYERLFMNVGPEAAELAYHPDVARWVVQREARKARWLKPLLSLPYNIRLLPTSAYGFLPGFGNPNVDPRADGNMPFLEAADPAVTQREFELYPFLAADPFIFAATGISNEYMTDIREFDDAPAALEPEPEQGPRVMANGYDLDEPEPPWPGRLLERLIRAIAQFFSN